MTRPTARVLALLEILQSGGTRTIAELAARLEVDERTVRRYVAHLVDLGIPVRSLRGRYGGYRLASGYRLPPLMFSDDEAVAVLLGLISGRQAFLSATTVTATESAIAKVQRVLPEVLASRLDALLETAEFTRGDQPTATPRTDILLTIAEATRKSRAVAITYTSAGDRRSERTVHPYGMVSHSGRWYVTGFDSKSDTTRIFRLDRILTFRMLDETFDAPTEFDASVEVLSGLARMPYRHEIALRVQGSIDDVRARLPPVVVASVEDCERPDSADQGRAVGGNGESDSPLEGWVRVRINAERLDWVPAVLAGLGLPFFIEQPAELRELVRALAAQLSAAAAES